MDLQSLFWRRNKHKLIEYLYTYKKILIISTNSLGDAYLSCSAISSLKKKFGDVRIDFVVNRDCEFFLKYAEINNIYYIDNKSLKSFYKLISRVNQIKYDYVFCFFPGKFNTLIYIFSNSIFKFGFINFRRLNEWHDISQLVCINYIKSEKLKWTPDMNFLERIKLVLSAAGIEADNIMKYKFPIRELKFQKNNSVLFCFSSRIANKSLSPDTATKIINYFLENENGSIHIIDTENKLLNFNSHQKLIVYKALNLKDLLELVMRCNAFIGVDSFPIHIADAYGAKIIGLFAPTNPASVLQFDLNKYNIIKKKSIEDINLQDIIEANNNLKTIFQSTNENI